MYMSPPYTTTAPKYQVIIENSCLPFQATPEEMLPLELLNFEAKLISDNDVSLQWQTTNEENVSHFVLERSKNGQLFTAIQQVAATNHNTATSNYQHTDENLPAGTWYYRLRMVDRDGTETLSHTVSVEVAGPGKLLVYPNPCSDWLYIQIGEMAQDIQVFNVFGQIIATYPQSTSQINMANWPVGVYLIAVNGEVVRVIKE
jgi:hypothetical protein